MRAPRLTQEPPAEQLTIPVLPPSAFGLSPALGCSPNLKKKFRLFDNFGVGSQAEIRYER